MYSTEGTELTYEYAIQLYNIHWEQRPKVFKYIHWKLKELQIYSLRGGVQYF